MYTLLSIIFAFIFHFQTAFSSECAGKTFDDIDKVPAVYYCFQTLFGTCSDPQDVQIQYLFYTMDTVNSSYPCGQSPECWKEAPFDGSKKTVIMTHGFLQRIDENDKLHEQRKKRLYFDTMNDDVNVILVDWKNGSEYQKKNPNYQQGVANVKVVGLRLANFIIFMVQNKSLDLDNLVLQGHSLGAQIMGTAARKVNETLGKLVGEIDGEDPAYPCFQGTWTLLSSATERALSMGDAKMVKVFHTDGGNKGTSVPSGHIDFFPNNGFSQPNCPYKAPYYGIGQSADCDHRRAKTLTQILYQKYGECQPVAYQCDNYKTFLGGQCASCDEHKCKLMAYSVQIGKSHDETVGPTDQRSYYIKTKGNFPFCEFHYQVLARSNPNIVISQCQYLEVSVEGPKRGKTPLIFSSTFTQYNSTILSTLITAPLKKKITGKPYKFLEASVKSKPSFFKYEDCAHKITEIDINYMSNLDEQVRAEYSTKLCRKNGSDKFVECKDIEI